MYQLTAKERYTQVLSLQRKLEWLRTKARNEPENRKAMAFDLSFFDTFDTLRNLRNTYPELKRIHLQDVRQVV